MMGAKAALLFPHLSPSWRSAGGLRPDGLEAAGIMADRHGIVTDSGFRTTAPGVYAIGDVNGRCMLAHAASAQGRVVLGLDVGLDVIPAAVFTFPEAAMVGLTEQCRAEGMELSIGKSMFRG